MAIVRVYWKALRHLHLRGYLYVWVNVAWLVLTLPIITAPAAMSGLFHLCFVAQTQPQASLNDFWVGFRARPGRDALLGLLSLLVIVVNLTNLEAYRTLAGLPGVALNLIWWVAIFLWLSVVLYDRVLVEEMAQPTLGGGLRNAALMLLQNPLFTLGVWVGIFIICVVSTILFPLWFLLAGSSVGILLTTAVLDRLAAAGYHNPAHVRPVEDQPL
ncbi:MAG: hypothetical protein MUE40_08375 [Anaerolineae bacterium]|jgi:hypothetical protein|nr:hypothetical protein [Anaerolineae bacterium]